MMLACAASLWATMHGCADKQPRDPDFFTSGSREADQRAQQQVSKVQQMRGQGGDESDKEKQVQKSLYERVGGEAGVREIVDDFIARAMADPRINWERKGIKSRGALGLRRNSEEWQPSEQNVAKLKQHMTEFIALATGGPTQYGGRDIRELHRGMSVTNAEFDATVGAFKATLDKLRVATAEQRELLAILESTRPQIVEQR
jgi:hemoglobin